MKNKKALIEDLEDILDTGSPEEMAPEDELKGPVSIRDSHEEMLVEDPDAMVPSDKGHRSDESFDKDLFLPIEELRILAFAFADDYGYDNFDIGEGEGMPTGLPPATETDKTQAKALLDSVYNMKIEDSRASKRVKNKDAFEKKQMDQLASEKSQVDTLNDLEVKHIIKYYKRLGGINQRQRSKDQASQTDQMLDNIYTNDIQEM